MSSRESKRWLYVPRGCAVFHVPIRNQHLIRSSLPTSHGFVSLPSPDGQTKKVNNPLPPSDKSPFVAQFEFVGTVDNSPYLCVFDALNWIKASCGGADKIREHNFDLARRGGRKVAEMLGTEVMENQEGRLGECCMSNVRLPLDLGAIKEEDLMKVSTFLEQTMVTEKNTFIAIINHGGKIWARLSAQIYLEESDFEFAGLVLKEICARVEKGEYDA